LRPCHRRPHAAVCAQPATCAVEALRHAHSSPLLLPSPLHGAEPPARLPSPAPLRACAHLCSCSRAWEPRRRMHKRSPAPLRRSAHAHTLHFTPRAAVPPPSRVTSAFACARLGQHGSRARSRRLRANPPPLPLNVALLSSIHGRHHWIRSRGGWRRSSVG
jgi:hypothetical protein